MFIIAVVVLPLAFWVVAVFDLPGWAFLAICCGLILAMTLAMLPPAKALVLGLQYRHRPEDFQGGEAG